MSVPKTLKLTYLNIKARGEPIRLALKLAGVAFEDERIGKEQLAAKKADGSLPSGQVPTLTIDGTKTVAQSTAILRYVGKLGTGDLYPKDLYEAALVDQLIGMVQDVEFSLAPSGKEKNADIRLQLRKELAAETLPKLFGFIDAFVAGNKAKFAIRDTVTIGDLFLYQMNTSYAAGAYDGIPQDVLAPFGNIARIVAAVKALPEVKDWEAAH